MKNEDISVYRPKTQTEEVLQVPQKGVVALNSSGLWVRDTPEDEPVAKMVITSTSTVYYVKAFATGRLLNPLSDIRIRKRQLQVKYKKVNPNCFNFYRDFLLTKNMTFFKKAEREIING